MAKLYEKEILTDLSYKGAVEASGILDGKGDSFITRPGYNEIHFMVKDDYFILTEDHMLIVNHKNIKCLDKDDWMVVKVTENTKEVVNSSIRNYYNKRKSRLLKK